MRTTVEEVRMIIDTALEDAVITSFIQSASLFIDRVLSDSNLDDEALEDIERWITAHLIANTAERQAKEEGAGGAFIKYVGDFGMGLKSTTYGQTAIMLDTSDTLKALADGRKNINLISL